MVSKKQRWIDLSAQGLYLGSIKMADGVERLSLIDMNNEAAPARLREIGFLPFEGSPRFDKGIYYLGGDQALRPSLLAAALGLAKCPLMEVAASEIDAVFRAKCLEKFQANLNAVTLRSEVLGQNAQGNYVYAGAAGRFVRTSKSEAVVERSPEGQALARALFLHADDEDSLRQCAQGFIYPMLGGAKASWTDVVKFGKVVFRRDASDGELHRLQEAIEAAAYQTFPARVRGLDPEAGFKTAIDFYYGLPTARMRTAESVALHQHSTPLPMSVVAQRLLMGPDDLTDKTVLEPTVGNGSLLNLMPEGAKLYGLELDEKRIAAVRENKRVMSELGDATTVPFRAKFGQPDGFDYTIANPPFGGLEGVHTFDKLKNIRRMDYYIGLRALGARKDAGRSVLIFGCDTMYSQGEVEKGARAFLNYVHDHYEVHGLVELDGRLYSRQGSSYNVRMLVVGDKLAEPRMVEVPQKLPILSTYDELWGWAEKVLEKMPPVKTVQAKPEPVIGDIVFVRGGQYDNTLRMLVGQVERAGIVSYVVSDTLRGSVVVPGVEFHRHAERERLPAAAEVGQRARFTAHDLGDSLSVGIVEGLVIDVASTSGGDWRYRISTDVPSPQGGGNIEKLVYGHRGSMEVLPEAVDEAALQAPEAQRDSLTASGTVAETGEVKAPGDLPDMAVVRDTDGKLFIVTYGRFDRVGGQPFTPGERPEMSYEVRVSFDLSDARRNPEMRAGPLFYTGLRYEGDWENVAKYQPESIEIDVAAVIGESAPAFTTEGDAAAVQIVNTVQSAPVVKVERRVNEFQTPYQPASKLGQSSAMVPINMAGSTYAALNDLEAREGSVDDYVATKLRYTKDELGGFFSPEQIDALALAIQAVESGRGIINADQTGMGKGRFVAGMMRYAKLAEKTPLFLTIKPELFTDIFRDIEDIGSRDLFKKLFIFNEGVHVMRFGTEDDILYRATSPQERRLAVESKEIDADTDMVLATYSQFQRAAAKNQKAQLLTAISQGKAMLFLDEAHVASGASNISAAVGEAVANCDGVVYSSATPLKGVSNFAIYNKVFPDSVDLKGLPDTLKAGGEALQEAISANMARDGVLIRREHDFSKLTFVTRLPDEARQAHNIELANKLSQVLSALSYLAGDVSKVVGKLNKQYEKDWDQIPESDRRGGRMRASSMNFGSRLYAVNRQFLLGIKIEESVQAALDALEAGRKPVVAVENTGESLLRQVLSRRAGVDGLEKQLEELDEKLGALTEEERAKREELQAAIGHALRTVRLDGPPQFRELLEIMLDRIGEIKVQGRYGDVTSKRPESEEYELAEERAREMIREFPDLALTPLDVLRDELGRRGFPITEVSGRTSSLSMDGDRWVASFHPKADAVANVAGFQNGKFDAIIITRSGSTGISLHATDRFADSDTRQRDFIVLQKASNIAEFLQWLGRVNRKDQVIEPVITGLDSGLPAELRLTMMHNAKLRKLSANTTSNRENANTSGEDHDLLNEVGDAVALQWLYENPDVADYLDIDLPKDDDEDLSRFSQECPYINKLLGRLMMVEVDKQQEILDTLSRRFADRIAELEQRGENPFKVDVFEWGAKVIKEEELQSGVLRPSGSTFDDAVKLVTLEYEQEVKPIRSEKLLAMIKAGTDYYRSSGPLDKEGTLTGFMAGLRALSEDALRKQLPIKLRDSAESLSAILAANDLPQVKKAKEKQEYLMQNLAYFKPGAFVVYNDLFKGELRGVVTSVDFPHDRDDAFLLSKYVMRVVVPGADKPKEISLATLFNQEQALAATSYKAIDPEKASKMAYAKAQMDQVLREYDLAEDGRITRRAHVLQGNLFRACELANQQRLGAPILFSDAEGNRQRAVLLRESITPDKVKALPIGLDARDMCAYIDEFLRPDHRDHRSRATYGALRIFDSGVKEMKKGEGIMLEVLNGGRDFRLTIPGTKSRAGRLMADASLFDVGAKTLPGSMKLKLTGTKAFMKVDIDRSQLPDFMRRMQTNGHVGKFYLPDPNQEILRTLKNKFANDHRAGVHIEHESELSA